ncbi:MAG TPA: carboxypeptidase-like regulatory domain-containing protein [Verrucomicrobiae bacterium]|nr:carboxypeptidase-like regulatory domain-containing protein [Verrucomicrobiae bacterium]
MNLRRMPLFVSFALLVVVVGGCPSRLAAQSSTTAGLKGTVSDSAGAAVPAATVALINDATNQTLRTTTDMNGSYGFSLLAPGTYRVEFSAQAFKTSQLASLAVNVSEIPVLDATLQAGAPAEQVSCQCRVTQTATSSTGTLIDSKTLTGVPLTTRNSTQVMSMSSGSASDVNNAGTLGRGTQTFNVNGNTTVGTYTVDGAAAGSSVPNPDAISEFKIQTSQYDAVYGANVPNTNLITRSGANDFHGDLWEFVRNDIFNANDFFLNAGGRPRPNLKQNQFGGTVGGPMKRNKLFFFGSFQATRQVNGLDPTSLSTLILPPLTNDRSAATIGSQFCPANKAPSLMSKYSTFAGGTQVACDGSNINPVALTLLQMKLPDGTYLVPTPQSILTSGRNAGLGSYSISLPSTFHENQYIANVDAAISTKQNLIGRVLITGVHQVRSLSAPYGINPGPQFVPGSPHGFRPRDYIASLKLTSILTSNIVNEAWAAYTEDDAVGDSRGVPPAASVGVTPLDQFFPVPPEIQVLGPLGSFRFLGNMASDTLTKTVTYQWADNISWSHGKHTTRMGVFGDTQSNFEDNTGAAKGKIVVQNFEDFLLGQSAAQNGSPLGRSNIQSIQASVGVGPLGELQIQYRNFYSSAFVEDDIKVNSRFTFNLGLRWEYIGPSLDTDGTIGNVWPSLLSPVPIPPASGTLAGYTVAANYNPKLINPYTGQPFGPLPPGVAMHSTKSFYQNGTPLDTFAPRIGFAWQPGGLLSRASIRGGYGWFYQAAPYSGNASSTPLFALPPFAQGFSNTDASNDLSTLQKPFPTATLGFVPRTPTSELSDRVAGPVYRIPNLQQWNVNAQYSLSPTFSLDLGYVGSYGSHLLLSHVLNQPFLASPTAPVNCGYDGIATDCITTNTSRNAKLRVPTLGETPTALAENNYIGVSWYHSMQATLRKRVSHGLTFQAAYTFSKAENDTTVYNDQNNLSLDWARATFDRTHRFIANYDYQLPAPRQRNGFEGSMLTGWSLAGIIIIQSGLPMTLTDPKGGGVYGGAGPSTITLCPGESNSSLVTSGRDQTRLSNWFNAGPTVICPAPAVGPDGSTGYGNTGLNIITGPGQFNTDFSLGKVTTVGGIRENAQLAFRVEFYNAFNHPQFANPGTTYGTANFGVITQSSVAPRLIQFGFKYLF